MLGDLRYALRSLIRSPGFSAVGVLSLAIGIGASASVFSLVNAVLLRSLPVPNPHELRVLQWAADDAKIRSVSGAWDNDPVTHRIRSADMVSYPIFLALREQIQQQADLFGYHELISITARAKREAFATEGCMVSGNFLSGLGVRPVIGRLLDENDDRAGAEPAVVISYGWWDREFSLDPAALGQVVRLNGVGYSVVGVLPQEFQGIRSGTEDEFYVAFSTQALIASRNPLAATDRWWVHLAARVHPGVSDAQLQASIDTAFARVAAGFATNPKILIEPGNGGTNFDRKYYRKPLFLLLSAVGAVILVACANLAGLSLARGAARQHELAVRAAIGAGRWRLVRQSLTENLLLAAMGAALGVLLAFWGRTAIPGFLVGPLRDVSYDTSLDLRVLGFTVAVALATGLLSGLLPALRSACVDPNLGLRSRTALGAPKLRGARVLIAMQVALSVILVSGAGLFVRTLVNLIKIRPGFAAENLLLFQVNPDAAGYTGARNAEYYDRVQTALAGIPGVRQATMTQFALLRGAMSGGVFTLPGHEIEPSTSTHRLTVGETFFETMQIPILSGRGFTIADAGTAPKVTVVNEAFARKYLSGDNAIGQTVKFDTVEWQIVGICGDAMYNSIKQDIPPTVYLPYRQDRARSAFFAVRTSLPPRAIIPAVRREVSALDPNVPLANISTQIEVRDQSISQERTFAMLCGSLAGLAVLLSCIGLYGLMAYNVARRTSEIGIRMALGATRSQISGPVLRSALLTTSIGVMIGIAVSLALSQIVQAMLYGVQPRDPLTLTGAAIGLLLVAALAAWIPARRAARVDPMVALRSE